MEEGAKGGNPASATSPVTENIPKTRFDEVVGQRNRSDEQLRAALQTVQILTQQVQQQRQPPRQAPQEHPLVKKMREEGRVDEANFLAGLSEQNRRLTATQAAMIEDMDRRAFIDAFGAKGAQKRINEVEQMVEEQRRRGNFGYSRVQAFESLIARDTLTREEAAPATTTQVTPPAAAAKAPEDDDAPPSDPQQVTSIRQGGGSEVWDEKTRDKEYQNLKDIEF